METALLLFYKASEVSTRHISFSRKKIGYEKSTFRSRNDRRNWIVKLETQPTRPRFLEFKRHARL